MLVSFLYFHFSGLCNLFGTFSFCTSLLIHLSQEVCQNYLMLSILLKVFLKFTNTSQGLNLFLLLVQLMFRTMDVWSMQDLLPQFVFFSLLDSLIYNMPIFFLCCLTVVLELSRFLMSPFLGNFSIRPSSHSFDIYFFCYIAFIKVSKTNCVFEIYFPVPLCFSCVINCPFNFCFSCTCSVDFCARFICFLLLILCLVLS